MIRTLVASCAPMFVALAVVGCGGSEPPPPEAPANPPPAAEPAKAPEAAPAAAATPAPEPKKDEPKKSTPALVIKDAGFSTPESVFHDTTDDVYLVSNINGNPGDKDNNGFISKVSPDGKVLELKWIEGGKKGVKLDAPKGMSISGDTLYVADISVVRAFDRKTGKPKADVKLDGATFVNDISTDGAKTYVSDTGIKFTDKGPESTKSAAVWVIEKGKAKSLAKGDELGGPNGVVAGKDGVWVVTFQSGELYRIDEKGQRQQVQKLPKGMLDGITVVGDTVLVSSWEAGTIYRGKPGGTFEPAVTGMKAPADIGYDAKRSRVLVPLFKDNAIEVYDVK
jgi:hypothetical protein